MPRAQAKLIAEKHVWISYGSGRIWGVIASFGAAALKTPCVFGGTVSFTFGKNTQEKKQTTTQQQKKKTPPQALPSSKSMF